MKQKVIVGMSGGVDSAVSAYLLQQQGYDVIGVYMKNWEDDAAAQYRDGQATGCSWEQDMADVRAVCAQLGIPYMTFNFVKEYKERVFSEFVKELEAGRTPNPDILCNQEIKFRLFFEKALEVPGVTAVATGHYAKSAKGQLLRPADHNKDQTYFLYRMNPEHLPHVLFPLENMQKPEVRAIAIAQGFPNAEKKDSTGICFIGDIDYRTFVNHYIQKKPGAIILTDGTTIGEHHGLHLYTIGQRKGIDIGGTGPFYVVEKRMVDNTLVVTNNSEDPLLYTTECIVEDMHWLLAHAEQQKLLEDAMRSGVRIHAQVRYRQEAQTATLYAGDNGTVRIVFDQGQRAVTPGQSAVMYIGDRVLGGGIIQ